MANIRSKILNYFLIYIYIYIFIYSSSQEVYGIYDESSASLIQQQSQTMYEFVPGVDIIVSVKKSDFEELKQNLPDDTFQALPKFLPKNTQNAPFIYDAPNHLCNGLFSLRVQTYTDNSNNTILKTGEFEEIDEILRNWKPQNFGLEKYPKKQFDGIIVCRIINSQPQLMIGNVYNISDPNIAQTNQILPQNSSKGLLSHPISLGVLATALVLFTGAQIRTTWNVSEGFKSMPGNLFTSTKQSFVAPYRYVRGQQVDSEDVSFKSTLIPISLWVATVVFGGLNIWDKFIKTETKRHIFAVVEP